MSIYFSGTIFRSAGLTSAVTKQMKLINLKPVKKIHVQFDPFQKNAFTAREFLFHITTPKILDTNINCNIKTSIVCDRSEPQIKIDLLDSGSVKFLADNLSLLELLQLFNKHISSLVKEEDPLTPLTITKSEKQKLQKKR